jgi:hypothetical protein
MAACIIKAYGTSTVSGNLALIDLLVVSINLKRCDWCVAKAAVGHEIVPIGEIVQILQ